MLIYQKTPQYHETDQMGIIHHANYIRWFEEARVAYLQDAGFSMMKEVDSPIISPVLTVEAKYLQMVRLHDKIEIFTWLTEYNGFRYSFLYDIINKDTKKICCTGITTHCFLTPDSKPLRMKRAFPELHQLLMQKLEEDTESGNHE